MSTLLLGLSLAWSAPNDIKIIDDENGYKLNIDGEDTMLFGMNWGYVPIGTNYSYNLWDESDEFIEKALRREMGLLQGMGVNPACPRSGSPGCTTSTASPR